MGFSPTPRGFFSDQNHVGIFLLFFFLKFPPELVEDRYCRTARILEVSFFH